MEIKPASVIIRDDFGLKIEIKPRDENMDIEQVVKDCEDFFGKYRVVSAYKVESSKLKEPKEKERQTVEISPRKVPLGTRLTRPQRIHIIKEELPKEFGMFDFIEHLKTLGYTEEDAKDMWKSTHAYLTKKNKLEKVEGCREKQKMKYRYVKDLTPDAVINDLKSGKKIELGTVRDNRG